MIKMNICDLSTRKIEILKALNKFGSLRSKQLSELFSLDLSNIQRPLKWLIETKLVKMRTSRYNNEHFYYATMKGIQAIESDLKTIKSIKWHEIRHESVIISFIKENQLKLDDFWLDREINYFVKSARTPDLIINNPLITTIKHKNLQYEITSKTAIEFETTWKSVERYKKLFYTYEFEFCDKVFDKVIFFMTSQIFLRINKYFPEHSHKIIFKEW